MTLEDYDKLIAELAEQWVRFVTPDAALKESISKNIATNFYHGACFFGLCTTRLFKKEVPKFLQPLDIPAISIFRTADPTHKKSDFHSMKRYFNEIQMIPFLGHGRLS